MASITVSNRNALFPVGTSVGLFPSASLPHGAGADRPPGAASIVSATVAADGSLTFNDPLVVAETPYVAYAQVAGEHRALRVRSSDAVTPRGLAAGTGNTTNGSPSVTSAAATSGAFAVGQRIEGPGIPPGTFVKAFSGGTITLGNGHGASVNATATGTGVALTASGGNSWRAVVRRRQAALGV